MDFLESGKRVIQKEISALSRLQESLGNTFNQAAEVIYNSKGKIIFTGLGKSGHMARKCATTFSSLGLPSMFIHAGESLHGDLGMVSKDEVVLVFSKSGYTEELIKSISYLKDNGSFIIGITGNSTSELAKLSNVHLDINIQEEADFLNLAPTSSTTAMAALGDALASAVSEKKGFTSDYFHRLHPGGSLGKLLEKK